MKKSWLAEVNKSEWILAEVLSDKRKDTRIIINQIEKINFSDSSDQNAPEKLKELISKEKINAKNLKISLACAGVVFRIVSVPKMRINKLNQFIYNELDQCFSFDLTDYIIDYRIIRRFKNLGQDRISILLAAVPKVEVEEATAVWKSAGIIPRTVDLGLDCIIRLFKALFDREAMINRNALVTEENYTPDHVAIVDFRHDKADLIIMSEGQLAHFSSMKIKLPCLYKTLDETAAETAGAAEKISKLSQGSIEYELRGMIPEGNRQLGKKNSEREFILEELFVPYYPYAHGNANFEETFESVIESIEAAFRNFTANHAGQQIQKLYIIGEYADFPGLKTLIKKELQINTASGYPGTWKPEFSESGKLLEKEWLSFSGIYGLTLREDK